MATDALWNVGNLFYLGAYQSAINEAQELHRLTDAEETERDFFVYRAYVALKKYEVTASGHLQESVRSVVIVAVGAARNFSIPDNGAPGSEAPGAILRESLVESEWRCKEDGGCTVGGFRMQC